MRDNGPGLSESERKDAFGRFWRKAENQNSPGTGLGLAIVRQIATASGAEVVLTNHKDGSPGLSAIVICQGV